MRYTMILWNITLSQGGSEISHPITRGGLERVNFVSWDKWTALIIKWLNSVRKSIPINYVNVAIDKDGDMNEFHYDPDGLDRFDYDENDDTNDKNNNIITLL